MSAETRTVGCCEWFRCDVTEDLEHIPGTDDCGNCPVCRQTAKSLSAVNSAAAIRGPAQAGL